AHRGRQRAPDGLIDCYYMCLRALQNPVLPACAPQADIIVLERAHMHYERCPEQAARRRAREEYSDVMCMDEIDASDQLAYTNEGHPGRHRKQPFPKQQQPADSPIEAVTRVIPLGDTPRAHDLRACAAEPLRGRTGGAQHDRFDTSGRDGLQQLAETLGRSADCCGSVNVQDRQLAQANSLTAKV